MKKIMRKLTIFQTSIIIILLLIFSVVFFYREQIRYAFINFISDGGVIHINFNGDLGFDIDDDNGASPSPSPTIKPTPTKKPVITITPTPKITSIPTKKPIVTPSPSLKPTPKPTPEPTQPTSHSAYINLKGKTIETRFELPEGYRRVNYASGSEGATYAEYLRNLKLKPSGSPVLLFDGTPKSTNYHEAVIKMTLAKRDLQQCADSIIRLRAEYLYESEQYNQIHFNFTSGFRADFSKWMSGYSIRVKNDVASWVSNSNSTSEYSSFLRYLNTVYTYAGTISLAQELKSVNIDNIKIGDIFIKAGSPGHAEIVVDLAVNKKTGEKKMILAQGFMPAQEIHILKNLNDPDSSPWYPVDFGEKLITPEYTFYSNQLMRFTN